MSSAARLMMRRMSRQFVIAICGALGLTQTASAQNAAPIVLKRNTCPACQITLTKSAELGDDEGPGEVSSNPFVTCSSTGTYSVTTASNGRPTSILQYDAGGRYLRTLGRSGSGPGEYRAAFPVRYGAGDSLFVFDLMAQRQTVLGRDRKIVRTVNMPLRVSAAVPLVNGATIVYSATGNVKQPSMLLHVVDAGGKLVRSFAAKDDTTISNDDQRSRRVISRSARGVWAARVNEYRLEEWDVNGKLLRTLLAPVSWFPVWTPEPGKSSEKQRAYLVSVHEDRDGLLWTLTQVRDKRYRVVPPGTDMRLAPSDVEQFDTVIEVIDPRAGAVLASRTVDQSLRAFACERTTYAYWEDAEDKPHVGVWKTGITRR